MACRKRLKQRKAFKKDISKELISVAWSSDIWGFLAHFELGLRTIITKTILKNNQTKKIIPLKLTKILIILIFKVLNKY